MVQGFGWNGRRDVGVFDSWALGFEIQRGGHGDLKTDAGLFRFRAWDASWGEGWLGVYVAGVRECGRALPRRVVEGWGLSSSF